MNLLERYQHDIDVKGFRKDAKQLETVQRLQGLINQLIDKPKQRWFSQHFLKNKTKPIKGLYLYGGVGRGKSYLMDLFFESLPFSDKKRMHFYHFMRYVHQQLDVHKGKKNPLIAVAESFTQSCRVLCLDEFFVTDIGDAMILGNLLRSLFENNLTLVTTSNIEPENLYLNGLQRQQFIPAIKLIKHHLDSYYLQSDTDYRLLELRNINRFFEGEHSDEMLIDLCFQLFNLKPTAKKSSITINGREIDTIAKNLSVIWFHFNDICEGPRSAQDYIDIAHTYKTIIISYVPEFNNSDDIARRFISLIDECYDQRVIVLLSSAKKIEAMYSAGRIQFEFERTQSRLIEIQTEAYHKKTKEIDSK